MRACPVSSPWKNAPAAGRVRSFAPARFAGASLARVIGGLCSLVLGVSGGVGVRGAAAAPAGEPAPLVLPLPTGAAGALAELGEDVVFFTSRRNPVRAVGDVAQAGLEVATADLALARPLMAFLRAAGVPLSGGAFDIARLVSPNHFPSLFTRNARLRLLVARRSPELAALGERAGARRVVFRSPDGKATLAAAPIAAAATAPSPGAATPDPASGKAGASGSGKDTRSSSFGPVVSAVARPNARHRVFVPADVRIETRQAAKGRQFVVVEIRRDFSAGFGRLAYLFGSGIVVEPDFSTLVLVDSGGRRTLPQTIYDAGPTLELGYEVPQQARGFRLEDGAARIELKVVGP